MLKKLRITQEVRVDIDSDYYRRWHKMYEEIGDHISLQYGGSIAHHANTGKKKSIFEQTAEMFTSIQRHFANNFTDPQK